ncbi:MAG TPA: AAA family ATPase [Acidimicrobiales bacterium]|nr:AAA family ATPase [Acidimicrobiales bacterium]
MGCTACGADNRADAAYCASCGNRLCPTCGAATPARARYCDSCGTATAAAPAGEDAERRPVTVLFADAAGSTALTQRIGDEEAYRLMQRAVAHMVQAVERHHGTVTQFRGDGVMALFGAPVAREHSAVDAVVAALELQDELGRLSDELAERLGATCPFRIGIHTGPVVVGRLADRVVVDITAVGDTANVAARLEQAAEPGTVYISEASWRVVRDFVACAPVGALRAKGVGEPVVAYRALRRTAVRSRLEAASARGLSRFVGRHRELALLEAMVGRNQAVLVVGEAGIGKSRLLMELRVHVGDRVRWVEGHCRATGAGTPWLPVVDLLRNALGVDEATDPAAVATAVDATMVGRPDAAPYLKWLLRAVGDDAVDPEPQSRRAAIHDALRAFADEVAEHGPVVVAVEDLHWADDASQAAVAAMADAPVLLLATARPGYEAGAIDIWTTKLGLDQLAPDDAAALAAGALGVDTLPAEVCDLVAARTDGNPLFVEEVAAALAETGAVRRDGDGWALGPGADALAVPTTLEEVILARIDRLDPEARAALQLAAVIGREFTRTLLERIARLDHPLDGHLGELTRLELIRQKSHMPELTFLFKHALTHEVTYSTLLADRRRQLHRVVALAIEELYGPRVDEVADELARHWTEAGDEGRALDYLDAAAGRALSTFSVREARAYFRTAVDLCRRIDDARLATFAAGLGQSHLAAGDMDDAWQAFDEGAVAARLAGDRDGEVVNLGWRAYCEVFTYRFDAAEGTLDAATAPPAPDSADARLFALAVRRVLADVTGRLDHVPALEAAAAPLVAHVGPMAWSMWQGMVELRANWRAQWEDIGPLLHRFPELPNLVDRAATLWTSGMAAAGRGDYVAALDLLRRQLDMAERLGEVAFRARALNTVGWVHGDLGDLDGAVAWNERCLEFLVTCGMPDVEIESNARLNLADAHLAAGRLDEAARELQVVERVVRRPSSPGDQWMRWRYSQHWFHTAGELALARGAVSDAAALADECFAAARETDSPKNEVKGLRLRGQCLLAAGDTTGALGALGEAGALAETVRNPPQLWRTLTALAEARRAAGDGAGAAIAAKGAEEAIGTVVATLGAHPLAAVLAQSADAQAARAYA